MKELTVHGKNIKYFRKEKRLTQKDLQGISGINQSTLTRYENGKLIPRIGTLREIANALDVPIELFFIKIQKGGKLFTEEELNELMKNRENKKHQCVGSIFQLLTFCRDYLPNKRYHEILDQLNDFLEDYEEDKQLSEITLFVNRFSRLYSKLTPRDYRKILTAFDIILDEFD